MCLGGDFFLACTEFCRCGTCGFSCLEIFEEPCLELYFDRALLKDKTV